MKYEFRHANETNKIQYDFDLVIDRRNTNSLKYDFNEEYSMPQDIMPLWVADMDFQAPPQIIEALLETVTHGIFGYSDHKQDYLDALHKWFRNRYNWDFSDKWLVKTPGVVFSLATAINAYTQQGDAVMIQQPVYYPFAGVVKANDRRLVINSLYRRSDRAALDATGGSMYSSVEGGGGGGSGPMYSNAENGGGGGSGPMYSNTTGSSAYSKKHKSAVNDYEIDFEDFEQQIIDEQVKLFLLCSPHNPVGRVWSEHELRRIGEICLRHDVLIVSDEIHADFIFPGNKHTLFSSLSPELAEITILCTAPSKTFNLAGLQAANIFIANDKLRRQFIAAMNRSGYSQISITGLRACQAAYQYGADWLDQLLEYLQGNLDWLQHFVDKELPQVKLVSPQGTYLVWLDFRHSIPNDKERKDFIVNRAKLWLDAGTMFGQEGSGYERINIACPRATLVKAMNQLWDAFHSR